MIRPSPLLPRLAALLALALVALAAGPSAAAVADALGPDCCSEHCPMAPPANGPAEAPVCCAQPPAVAHDAATVPPAPTDTEAPVAHETLAEPLAPPPREAPPTTTGAPPGPRRHLTLSVLLV
ncbi:MAG: hypothetical protein AAGI91_13360 [Bacteroidota bacterium]